MVGGDFYTAYTVIAVAANGLFATMPSIALQLVGMDVVIKALGFPGELPLIAAFAILELCIYSAVLANAVAAAVANAALHSTGSEAPRTAQIAA